MNDNHHNHHHHHHHHHHQNQTLFGWQSSNFCGQEKLNFGELGSLGGFTCDLSGRYWVLALTTTTFQNINLNISHFNILNADFYAKFCKLSIKGHFIWNHPKFPLPMHSSKGSRPRTSSFKHSRRSSFHKLKRWLWLSNISMIPDPQDVKFPLEIIAIMFILIKESFRGSQNIFHWRSLNAISKATINRIIDLSIGASHHVKK